MKQPSLFRSRVCSPSRRASRDQPVRYPQFHGDQGGFQHGNVNQRPLPLRSRRNKAAAIAKAAVMPPMVSATGYPTRSGAESRPR